MIGLRMSAALLIAASSLGPLTPDAVAQSADTATQTVDTMNELWGSHPGTRANHAKGIVVEGRFVPTLAAKALSKANIFAGKPIPVLARFSDSTGIPTVRDGSDLANPHGMAIRFLPPGSDPVDVVTNSLAFFPVATAEDFLALLQALAASGPDAPTPTKAEQFIGTHPSVLKAFASATTPTSFARDTYNGVNAFVFVDAAGKRQPFRLKLVPVAGAQHMSTAAAASLPANFLMDELPKRMAKHKVAFHLMAQLANPGDQTKDPSQPWPADRRLVELGRITLTKPVVDNDKAQRELGLLPNQLTPGIEASDDPMIEARVKAYVISYQRRSK
jgi:catalase